jgi:hypothetical protein
MRTRPIHAVALLIALAGAGAASAQSTPASAPAASPTADAESRAYASMRPEKATLSRLQRRMTLKVEDTRLEDVFKFIAEVSQADLEPLWTTENATGLDKDKRITINVQSQPALYVIEAVLEKARADAYAGEASWQMTPEGTVEIGPKELLNKHKRVVMYDINDLLMIIPRYTDVPSIDLNSVLQQSQGGSGTSPFQNANSNNSPLANLPERAERTKKIIDLLQSLVEPTQWVDNGGEGASMREFNGVLIVNAADYIHRQINGYPYWPGGTVQRVAMKGGPRYVTLNMDTGLATPGAIRQVPVTAVVGGTPVSSAPPKPPKPGTSPPPAQPKP